MAEQSAGCPARCEAVRYGRADLVPSAALPWALVSELMVFDLRSCIKRFQDMYPGAGGNGLRHTQRNRLDDPLTHDPQDAPGERKS